MTVIYFVELTLDQISRVFQGRYGIIVIKQYLPATSDWLALFPNFISIQKWKQRGNCWHRIQKFEVRLVGKIMPS